MCVSGFVPKEISAYKWNGGRRTVLDKSRNPIIDRFPGNAMMTKGLFVAVLILGLSAAVHGAALATTTI